MDKKEVVNAKRNELKEEKKDKRFKEFMETQAKKIEIEEKTLVLETMCEKLKVKYVKADDLDDDAAVWIHHIIAASLCRYANGDAHRFFWFVGFGL